MGFSCGIVGLPNVGKSTLFNAITNSNVEASNYPFCTIEPNVGVVAVPDERLTDLAKINSSKQILPTTIQFTDIAGLVKGAAKGEGLGNQFLSNIRQVDAIVQVVRIFKDPNIVKEDELNPVNDLDVINTELILSDLEIIEKHIANSEKLIKNQNDKEAKQDLQLLFSMKEFLENEKLLKDFDFDKEQRKFVKKLNLLTIKPMLIVANISEEEIDGYLENSLFKELSDYCQKSDQLTLVPISIKVEREISLLEDEKEKAEYLEMVNLSESGLDRLILASYKLLDLITYITSGEKETKAWTIQRGTLAPQAAGVIHTDFEKGFIKAEVISSRDLIEAGSVSHCRDKGKVRIEGKEYEMQDGDVCEFRFNL